MIISREDVVTLDRYKENAETLANKLKEVESDIVDAEELEIPERLKGKLLYHLDVVKKSCTNHLNHLLETIKKMEDGGFKYAIWTYSENHFKTIKYVKDLNDIRFWEDIKEEYKRSK